MSLESKKYLFSLLFLNDNFCCCSDRSEIIINISDFISADYVYITS